MSDGSSVSTLAQEAEAPEVSVEGAPESSEPDAANQNVPTPETTEGLVHAKPDRPDRRERAQFQTQRLDSRDLRPSWATTIASLEQLSGWAVLALRLGTLALIQQCVRELAQEHARADVIVRLRALTEALAHMPLES